MGEPLISSQQVSRLYRSEAEEIRAVDGVSMSVDPGELVLIRGRSGSGKTTLLSLMGGLETPSQGSVLYKGQDIGSFSPREMTVWRRQEIAFIFQAYALVPACCRLVGHHPAERTGHQSVSISPDTAR